MAAWVLSAGLVCAGGSKPGYRTPILTAPEALPSLVEKGFETKSLRGNDRNLPEPLARADARTFPYSMVGAVSFFSGRQRYSGSATLIKPTVALTAAHNLYDGREGFSTDVNFALGQYQGSAKRRARAEATYLYTTTYVNEADRNSDSLRAFATDTGWLTFSRRLSQKAAPYTSRIVALKNGNPTYALGYGLDRHNGRLPLSVAPTEGYFRMKGAYFENRSYGTEGGMSGGPVFGFFRGRLVQLGVVVSGFSDFTRSGIRVIDRGLVRKLRRVE